jgi:hypothetical protein
MIKDNEGVCFDVPEDRESELWNIFKKGQKDGSVSFAMEKTKKLPEFA